MSNHVAEAVDVGKDDVEWLSASEQHAWRNYMEASLLLMAQLDQELRASHGIGLSEYELLVRLSEQPEHSMRMAVLARDVAISRSRLTHIVGRMELRGLLVRSAIREDGRGVLCRMTKAGYALLQDSAPVHVRGVRRHVIDRLTEREIAVMGRAMESMSNHLRELRSL
ncbi:MarR family transcriptional regulator [Saxibacter everestensis]|uniref:MarR family transcriptional regulator n=1 Tax=Saxibacter everestensis TaxID=2909229 RepID=A0ABY8QPR9_9MICO|nr:MarR family transcriptional regulator [Brevibacteriaceae bacterium ZFBP1038]